MENKKNDDNLETLVEIPVETPAETPVKKKRTLNEKQKEAFAKGRLLAKQKRDERKKEMMLLKSKQLEEQNKLKEFNQEEEKDEPLLKVKKKHSQRCSLGEPPQVKEEPSKKEPLKKPRKNKMMDELEQMKKKLEELSNKPITQQPVISQQPVTQEPVISQQPQEPVTPKKKTYFKLSQRGFNKKIL